MSDQLDLFNVPAGWSKSEWLPRQADLMADISSLRGKVLGCWCWP